jgi:hypothetical protein
MSSAAGNRHTLFAAAQVSGSTHESCILLSFGVDEVRAIARLSPCSVDSSSPLFARSW